MAHIQAGQSTFASYKQNAVNKETVEFKTSLVAILHIKVKCHLQLSRASRQLKVGGPRDFGLSCGNNEISSRVEIEGLRRFQQHTAHRRAPHTRQQRKRHAIAQNTPIQRRPLISASVQSRRPLSLSLSPSRESRESRSLRSSRSRSRSSRPRERDRSLQAERLAQTRGLRESTRTVCGHDRRLAEGCGCGCDHGVREIEIASCRQQMAS